MHRDSVNKIYEVNCDDKADTLTVTIDGHTKKVKKMFEKVNIRECSHPLQIQTYLFSKQLSDSFYVFLDFYANRLISYSIYFKSAQKKHYVDSILNNKFGQSRGNLSNKKIKVSVLTYEQELSEIHIYDRRASELVPPWCGNSRRKGSWTKLEKYVNNE